MDHIIFEVGLALALVATATVLSTKLRFSAVPFLILAGMAVGPHMPKLGLIDLRFIQSEPLMAFMGRLGILFLLFYLGLEFSLGRLIKAGRSIALGGSIYITLNFTLGLAFAWLIGWPLREMLVATGITTISSSAIVAKVLVDLKRTANPETEMILGIIMFEDIFLAVYLTLVSGLVLSGAASFAEATLSATVALGFLFAVLMIGWKATPWLNRALNIPSDEVFLFMIFAGLLLVAGLSESLHVAEAIGALMVGLVLAETEHVQRIEHLIIPFRDFFGALFFFHFGLTIDPSALGGAVWLAMAAVVLTILGNFIAGMLAGRVAGLSPRASSNIGLTIISRGEFSIIMANLGRAGGLLPILQPFAALYVLILAILGPFMTMQSRPIYEGLNKVFRWRKAKATKEVAPLIKELLDERETS